MRKAIYSGHGIIIHVLRRFEPKSSTTPYSLMKRIMGNSKILTPFVRHSFKGDLETR